MTELVLAQALLPFYSTKHDGTGLGLALCREIAEAHGGSLRLATAKAADLRRSGASAGARTRRTSGVSSLTMDDETVERLELKLAFLERANAELSDVVYSQHKQLEALREGLRTLAGKLDAGQTAEPVRAPGRRAAPALLKRHASLSLRNSGPTGLFFRISSALSPCSSCGKTSHSSTSRTQ